MLWAYFGPETVMPLTSVLAAVVGGLLMFGRRLFLLAWMLKHWTMKKLSRRDRSAQWQPRNLRRDQPRPSTRRAAASRSEKVETT